MDVEALIMCLENKKQEEKDGDGFPIGYNTAIDDCIELLKTELDQTEQVRVPHD